MCAAGGASEGCGGGRFLQRRLYFSVMSLYGRRIEWDITTYTGVGRSPQLHHGVSRGTLKNFESNNGNDALYVIS